MSREYDAYLKEHISNVNNALIWMVDNLNLSSDEAFCVGNRSIMNFSHDETKWSLEEYDAYDAWFYGGNRSAKVKEEFARAWLHHQHHNPHHWEYWVTISDGTKEKGIQALEMPMSYVFEMIADWWSFSWSKGDLYSVFSWYDEHKKGMMLHPKTKELVESILLRIRAKLDEQKEEEKP